MSAELPRFPLLVVAGLLVVVLSACERGTPTASEATAAHARRGENSGAALGGFTLVVDDPAVPGKTGEQPLQGTGIAIGPGEWVRISVDGGSLTWKQNEAYRPLCASGTTCFPDNGKVVTPLDENYGIRVSAVYDKAQPDPGQTSSGSRLLGGGGAGSAAERIYHNTDPARTMYLWVRRAGPPGAVCRMSVCYPPSVSTEEVWTSRYSFSGTQQLVATRIPVPLRVIADKPRIAPNEAVTFRLETDAGMSDWNGNPTEISWMFSPNDTLPVPRGSGSVHVSACYKQPTCTYTPSSSGRMYASTSILGNAANEASEVVWRRDCVMFATPPADPLLSDPTMLNVLEDLAKRGKFTGPARYRTEHGGYILEKNGRLEYREWRYLPGRPTTCDSSHYDDRHIYVREGYTVLGEIHSHPSGTEVVINVQGGICPNQALDDDEFTLDDGPSGLGLPNLGSKRGDIDPWEAATHDAITGYVIDPLHLHRWQRVTSDDGASWHIGQSRLNLNKGLNRCVH